MIRNSWFKDALKRKVLYIKISILLIFEKRPFDSLFNVSFQYPK